MMNIVLFYGGNGQLVRAAKANMGLVWPIGRKSHERPVLLIRQLQIKDI